MIFADRFDYDSKPIRRTIAGFDVADIYDFINTMQLYRFESNRNVS